MNGFGETNNGLIAAARNLGLKQRGVGDFDEDFRNGIRPATSMPLPPGPADFPVAVAPKDTPGNLSEIAALLRRILLEMIRQSTPARPVMRTTAVDDVGQTLDFSQRGIMDRLMMKNKGPNSVWYGYDFNGPAVKTSDCDLSWEIEVGETINLALCQYEKIGLRCATGETAVVHAQGWQSVAADGVSAII